MPTEQRYKRVSRMYTDPVSGEVRELSHEEPIVSRRPPDRRENADFALIFFNAIPDLLAMDLRGNDFELFLALVQRMTYDEPFRVSQREISDSTGMPYNSVRIAMGRLRKAGAIFDVAHKAIIMNPTLVWRGTKVGRWEWVLRLRRDGRLPERTIPLEIDEQDRA